MSFQDVPSNVSACTFEVVNKKFLVPGFEQILKWKPQIPNTKADFSRPPFDNQVTQFFNRTFRILTLEVRMLLNMIIKEWILNRISMIIKRCCLSSLLLRILKFAKRIGVTKQEFLVENNNLHNKTKIEVEARSFNDRYRCRQPNTTRQGLTIS